MESPELAVNVKDVKEDYYVKKWHQEFWSGSGINTVLFWFPISIEKDMGGVEFIPGSHHWGHIPHRNREPIEIPGSAEFVTPQIAEGDGIMFHSLTLHRTVANQNPLPRFALPLSIKNFYVPDTGVPYFGTWRPFNFSPLANIHKKLGNPAFSPFRTLGSTRSDTGLDNLSGSTPNHVIID
jgi:ectoine hydroxylase-related dioxygenase (phytanoyl-CoA dioxygenase family)